MDSNSPDEAVKALLERWSRGDREALDPLLIHIYRDLYATAIPHMHSRTPWQFEPDGARS